MSKCFSLLNDVNKIFVCELVGTPACSHNPSEGLQIGEGRDGESPELTNKPAPGSVRDPGSRNKLERKPTRWVRR